MGLRGVLPFVLDFSAERPIEVEVSQAHLTGEAGLLPIRKWLFRRSGEVKNRHDIVSSFNRQPEACALRNTANTDNTPKRARLWLAVKRTWAKPPRNTG